MNLDSKIERDNLAKDASNEGEDFVEIHLTVSSLFQMEFYHKDSFNSFTISPVGNRINGRLLATFDATGVAGGNFRIICAAVRPVRFCFGSKPLYSATTRVLRISH
jgi:hypothetical protein